MDGAAIMAIYHVKGPDGVEHELEGPEGATDEQVIAKAQEAFGSQAETPMPAAIEADKVGLEEPAEQKVINAGAAVANGFGVGQMAGAVGTGGLDAASGIRNYLSNNAGKFARKTAIEAIEPTTTNIDQLKDALGGRQGVEDAGQYLLDQKVVTPGASADDMTARLGGLADRAGRHIGEWRDTADLRSLAQGAERPTSLDIEKAIREKLAAKYGPGAEAGQGGELENAINEVRKLAPVEQSTTGAEMAQTLENNMPPEPTPGNKFWRDQYGVAPDEVEAYNAARSTQETLPEMTDGFPYLNDKPTFSELADTSTRLNTVAKNARQINQPSGAMTDAANVLSQKSTEGLETFLQPPEQAAFAADKTEYGLTKGLEKITDRTASRDMAGSLGNALCLVMRGTASCGIR
jgi:hypothetical protein